MIKPLIAIPIGDPAGVGPEIVVMSIADKTVFDKARCIVIGDKNIINNAIHICKVNLKVNIVESPEQGIYEDDVLNLIDLCNIDMSVFEFGKVSGMCGKAAYEYIAKSIELANAGKVDAVATTPINKESLKAGDIHYIGHTEIFGALTNTQDPLTMFEVRGMRVFFLSRHVSLSKACSMVTKERIIDYVKRCQQVLNKLGEIHIVVNTDCSVMRKWMKSHLQ